MKSLVKSISYKLLIISMIMVVLSFCSTNSISQASKINNLKDGEFYYTGTQEAQLLVEESLFSKILKALAELANYILGIMTLGIRGVFVGWIQIMEIILTAILGVEMDFVKFFSDAISGMDTYSQQIVNVEKIIFNRVEILDANIFK